jgi:hypothetical protein
MHEVLIASIKQARWAERDIDERIALSVLGFDVERVFDIDPNAMPHHKYWDPAAAKYGTFNEMVPRFTGSIDAADGLFRRLLDPDKTGATWDSGSPRLGRASARATILGTASEFQLAHSTALAIVLVTIILHTRIGAK